MEINEIAAIRRENLQRVIDLFFKGNASALARRYGEAKAPSYFNDLLRNPEKSFGEKTAMKIEVAAGLKPGQMSLKDSPLEQLEARRDLINDEIVEALEDFTADEKRQVLDAMARIRSQRKRRRRA